VTDSAAAPRVSVVVPTFDGARFLPAMLAAVLGQTRRDLELIVVDDGSTDATPAILAEAARRDPRVRAVRQPRGGHTRATTHGLALARGDLYAHCDHDDVWEPTRLERGIDYLDAHPEVGVVGTWATVVDAADRPIGVTEPPCDPADVAAAMRDGDAVVNSTALARLALVRALGGHRQAFHQASDYDLWMRASERSQVANLPERLVRYRVHFGNTSVRRLEVTARGLVAARTAGRHRREGRPDTVEDRVHDPDELLRVLGADPAEVAPEAFGAAQYFADLARWAGDADAERLLLRQVYRLGRAASMSRSRARHLLERASELHAQEGRPVRALGARVAARLTRRVGARALWARTL